MPSSLSEDCAGRCGEEFCLWQRRLTVSEPAATALPTHVEGKSFAARGFSRERPSGFVAPQSKIHGGYSPSSRLAIRPFLRKHRPAESSDRLLSIRPRQRGKLVSAAGVAPAVTRAQTEHVAATLRAVCPGGSGGHRGLGFVGTTASIPWNCVPSKFWRSRWGLHPQSSRRQRVALQLSYESEHWWEALVTLQFVASNFLLRHPIYRRAVGSLPIRHVDG
jgi:hypothetical protein